MLDTRRVLKDDAFDPDVLFEFETVHPPLPHQKEHRCTDLPALLLLFASLGGSLGVQVYAHQHGNVQRLLYSFNYDGSRCGIDLPGKKFLFWCRYQGEVNSTDHTCIEDCPHGGEGTAECFDPMTKRRTVVPTYKTYRFLNVCLPYSRSEAQQLLQTSVGKTYLGMWLKAWNTVSNSWPLCFSRSSNGTQHPMLLQQFGADPPLNCPYQAWNTVNNSWPLLMVSLAISIGVGYSYLLLLRHFAAVLVRVFMLILMIMSTCIGASYVWEGCTGAKSHVISSGDSRLDVAFGVVLVGFPWSLLAYCITGLDTAIGCIEAASECVFHELTIFWEPFASLCTKVAVFAYMSWGLLLLLSCARIRPLNEYGILMSLELTPMQWFCIGFHLLTSLWLVELSASASYYVTAWVTQNWYFTPVVADEKHPTRTWGLCLAYSNVLRLHTGTLALGSLLIMVLRPVRLASALLVQLARVCSSCLGPCAAELCAGLITAHQELLERFRKSAYTDVAVTSEDFCKAATRAADIISNEVPAVATMRGTQLIFLVSGVGTISLVPTLAIWAVRQVTNYLNLEEGSSLQQENENYVYLVISIMCMSIGFSFMLVFDTVVDSIFYCFAVGQRRHRNQKFMRQRTRDVARALCDRKDQGSSFFEFFWSTRDDESTLETDEEMIDYAPSRLRQLINGQDTLYH